MSLVISIFVRGGEGAGVCLISGGGVKKRKSPDFRSPEVGISVSVLVMVILFPESFFGFLVM